MAGRGPSGTVPGLVAHNVLSSTTSRWEVPYGHDLAAEVSDGLHARLVVDAANGLAVLTAETRLHDRGVAVVPDLVASGGGVISAYFEWIQNHQRVAWSASDERRRVLEARPHLGARGGGAVPDWRDTALSAAIRRGARAMELSSELTPPPAAVG